VRHLVQRRVGGFFDTVGVKPILGAAFQPEDDVANARSVAVLNYNTWVRRFGSDPRIVGKTMTLDGSATEIVGVMPPASTCRAAPSSGCRRRRS
jgi:hypothetical protein